MAAASVLSFASNESAADLRIVILITNALAALPEAEPSRSLSEHMGQAARDILVPKLRPVDEVLGAIYRVDRPIEAWLQGIGAIRPFEEAIGHAICVLRDATSRGEGVGWVVDRVAGDELGRELLSRSSHTMRTTAKGDLFPSDPCASQSEVMGSYPLPEPWTSIYAGTPTRDVWALFGQSVEGSLIGVSHLLPRRAKTSAPARRFWRSVSIHISAAHRLVSALHDNSEAVLAPDGKVLHAEGVARDEASRDALRRAVRAIDRAKTKKTDPLAAIESWKAMVSGRWSLVDELESDGRRFMVARVNEPKLPKKLDLTGRERHIAALAALGRSNKEIAYELGLAPSSVASYLGRLRKKLGVRRSELIR